MAVDDLWYLKKRDDDKDRLPSRRHGRGKRWRVRYIDDAGRKVEKLFERKVPAEQFDASVRTDVARGQYIDPAAGSRTIEQHGERWREAQLHRDSTSALVESTLRLHLYPTLGSRALSTVRRTHIQAWVTELADTLAASTVRLIYSHASAMFAAAVLDRAIGSNPCVGVKLPALPSTKREILTTEQITAVANALRRDFQATAYVGAGCGLRPSEMLGLELDHVDFLRRELHVIQQLRTSVGRPPFLAPVKTKTSRRTVELPQITADKLAQHIERFPPVAVEVSDETNPRRPVVRSAKLLFTDGGALVSRSMWSKIWAPAARVAGLPPRTGFHATRHYHASLLIFAGASVATVQAALGHATPMTTLNEYVGLWPDQLDRTRNLVDAAFDSLGSKAASK
jgi:integrase